MSQQQTTACPHRSLTANSHRAEILRQTARFAQGTCVTRWHNRLPNGFSSPEPAAAGTVGVAQVLIAWKPEARRMWSVSQCTTAVHSFPQDDPSTSYSYPPLLSTPPGCTNHQHSTTKSFGSRDASPSGTVTSNRQLGQLILPLLFLFVRTMSFRQLSQNVWPAAPRNRTSGSRSRRGAGR